MRLNFKGVLTYGLITFAAVSKVSSCAEEYFSPPTPQEYQTTSPKDTAPSPLEDLCFPQGACLAFLDSDKPFKAYSSLPPYNSRQPPSPKNF